MYQFLWLSILLARVRRMPFRTLKAASLQHLLTIHCQHHLGTNENVNAYTIIMVFNSNDITKSSTNIVTHISKLTAILSPLENYAQHIYDCHAMIPCHMPMIIKVYLSLCLVTKLYHIFISVNVYISKNIYKVTVYVIHTCGKDEPADEYSKLYFGRIKQGLRPSMGEYPRV